MVAINGKWFISKQIHNSKRKGWLPNTNTNALTVPQSGWEFSGGNGTWLDDPTLTQKVG